MHGHKKLQLEEQELLDQEEFIRLKEKEEDIKERKRQMAKKAAEWKAKELEEKLPEHVEDADDRTKTWVGLAQTVAMDVKHTGTGARPKINLQEGRQEEGGEPASARRIRDLEKEVERLKAADPRVAPPVDKSHAIKQLKEMGLMRANLSEEMFNLPPQDLTEKEKLRMGIDTANLTGKPSELPLDVTNGGELGEKGKLKIREIC